MALATTPTVPAGWGRQAGWEEGGGVRSYGVVVGAGVSEPKVFLLLKQVGEGEAEARRRRGVLHAGAERW